MMPERDEFKRTFYELGLWNHSIHSQFIILVGVALPVDPDRISGSADFYSVIRISTN